MKLKKNPHDILQEYWGFSSFIHPQESIINSILDKKDALILLPTGGGKSVCYQVPALINDGICIVVSPLIALIKDQVNTLKDKGIKAIGLTSSLKFDDVDALLDNCIYGNYKFLYLSPERLQQDLVQQRIRNMNVNLIAIDEAHCISQWGNDFRPAYRNCVILKEFFPDVPMVALTASATRVVASDIVENLQLNEPAIIKKTFKRNNLSYQVFETEDKNYELEKLLKENTGSAIVYVRSRKATIETSGFLNKKGISADFFHGGISNNDKDKKLAAWLNNQTRVMVATNAFGMGIDKADVQTIVHLNFPESLESYYQEAGRAGRNGDKAYAVILKSGHDEGRLKNQFVKTLPDVNFIKLLYNKLNNYFQISYGEGVQETFPLNFNHFCQTYDLPAMLTYNGLRVLDRYSVIALNETYYKKMNIQFTTTNNQLFYYMDQHPSVENIVQSILRTYGSVFDMPTTINTLLISKKSKTFEQKVLDVLQQLQKDEIIDYEATDTDTLITFLTPREDDKTINVIAKPIEQQNELKIKRVEAVINYTNNDTVCKSIQLLRYFDEEEKEPCGICSVCAKNENDISGDVLSIIKEEIIKSLKKQCMTSRELVENITFKEPYILDALKDLLDDEILSINSKNQYCIN
ncbi:RecQ family ATP-dependent DNA helicase [Galbibacter sp. EGI 63066]|uniref:RecQ family ATP-dependent DNA helicase n=1 Tax=Galbibacter sp. EGI 63066 TaxID=2993559 RepID=UPI0022490FCD|nr:RecQ family ATP-dependent DNA helicase [Galbibacter sp. EGI 63066]MCX2680907.1 RecQ family ATP-dependent DNA helicase [Galbibacter sp. EGI 63066]